MYLTAAAPLQTQAETTAKLHEKKFLPGFAEDAWETASLDSKTELAKQLAAYELAMLGVPDGTEITVQPPDEDRFGYYFRPVEIDARAYAAEETERLQGLIDKELQKET